MKREYDERGAESRLPAPLLRRQRLSRANVLVLGGSPARRLDLARRVHDQGPFAHERFCAFDCTRDEAQLARTLEGWLIEDGRPLAATGDRRGTTCGVVYLESVSQLSETTQRLLLIVAHRLQGHPSEPGHYGPVRLMAGERSDPVLAEGATPLVRSLVDHLDKIRIDAGRARVRGAA